MSASEQRLWVWDFDETVLRIHAYGLRLTVEDVAARSVEEDCADLDFFRAFVADVLAAGDLVAVASFGKYEVIQAYMDRIAPGLFNRANVSTPSCVGGQDGCSVAEGKVPQLELLMHALLLRGATRGGGAADRRRVVFFDDDVNNAAGALRSGFTAMHTPRAFTRTAWAKLIAQAQQAGLTTFKPGDERIGSGAAAR